MNFNSIKQICKGAKRIELYTPNADGVQWIGDGGAFYPLYDFPRLEGENVFALFDIPESKRDKIHLWQHSDLPKHACFEDHDDGESLVEQSDVQISLNGRRLIPLKTSLGAMYINEKYLAPFKDSENGVQLYERTTPGGKVYVAAKEGFLLTGIILPYDVVTKGFVEELAALHELSKIAYENYHPRGGIYEMGQEATLFAFEREVDE